RPRLAQQRHPLAARDLDRNPPQRLDPGVLRPVHLPYPDRLDHPLVPSVAIRSHRRPTQIRSAHLTPVNGQLSYQITPPPPEPAHSVPKECRRGRARTRVGAEWSSGRRSSGEFSGQAQRIAVPTPAADTTRLPS